MIYDDQPQMVDAVSLEVDGGPLAHDRFRMERAFAAIDREALIQKVLAERGGNYGIAKMEIEAVLVAAGIIPERKRG